METINGLYKAECIRTTVFHDGPYKTIADVEYATAGWVDWYNPTRATGVCRSRAPRRGVDVDQLPREARGCPDDALISALFGSHRLRGR